MLGGCGFVLGWWMVWLFGMGWECDVGHVSSRGGDVVAALGSMICG